MAPSQLGAASSLVVEQLTDLLRRKQQIDQSGESGLGYAGGEGRYTQRQRWMGEAIELLLRLALENERRRIEAESAPWGDTADALSYRRSTEYG